MITGVSAPQSETTVGVGVGGKRFDCTLVGCTFQATTNVALKRHLRQHCMVPGGFAAPVVPQLMIPGSSMPHASSTAPGSAATPVDAAAPIAPVDVIAVNGASPQPDGTGVVSMTTPAAAVSTAASDLLLSLSMCSNTVKTPT